MTGRIGEQPGPRGDQEKQIKVEALFDAESGVEWIGIAACRWAALRSACSAPISAPPRPSALKAMPPVRMNYGCCQFVLEAVLNS
jgi:hypothetical protein